MQIVMKKNILTLLFSICFTVAYAQENTTEYVYHPLSEFGADTLRFLKTNFERKSSYFKGKPFGEVLKYYKKDLPVNIFFTNWTSPYIDPEGKSYIESLTLSHYEYTYYHAALRSENTRVLTFDVYISPEPRIDNGKFWRDMPDFQTDEEEAEYASGLIVDHIRVFYLQK